MHFIPEYIQRTLNSTFRPHGRDPSLYYERIFLYRLTKIYRVQKLYFHFIIIQLVFPNETVIFSGLWEHNS